MTNTTIEQKNKNHQTISFMLLNLYVYIPNNVYIRAHRYVCYEADFANSQ